MDRLELPGVYRRQAGRLHTSSDGQKYGVAVEPLNANYSFKYLGKEPGVSPYTCIDERHFLWHHDVISAAEREAAYVVDGLMHNDVRYGHDSRLCSAAHNRESWPYLGILRLWAHVKNDWEATAYLISKTFLCASGGWYILGLSRELDAVRRSGLCGMV
jgi:hypothetical protein